MTLKMFKRLLAIIAKMQGLTGCRTEFTGEPGVFRTTKRTGDNTILK